MLESVKSDRSNPICVLCGSEPASTGQGDHIPPKSIYTNAERKAATYRFHTVPACTKCNGAGSQHDEALKLLIGFASGEDRQCSQDVIDTMAKTIGKNQRLANQIFSTAKRISLERPPGLQIPIVTVVFDEASYKEAISRIARGMYWRMTGTILDPSIKIEVVPIQRLGSELMGELQECSTAFPLTEINGGTLKCKLIETDEANMMVIQFFSKHTALALIYSNIGK